MRSNNKQLCFQQFQEGLRPCDFIFEGDHVRYATIARYYREWRALTMPVKRETKMDFSNNFLRR